MKLFGLFFIAALAQNSSEIGIDSLLRLNNERIASFFSNTVINAIPSHFEGCVAGPKIQDCSVPELQSYKVSMLQRLTNFFQFYEFYIIGGRDELTLYEPYGCHCSIQAVQTNAYLNPQGYTPGDLWLTGDLMAGSSQPLDEIDSACKRHKDCLACAMAESDGTCHWWQYPYNIIVTSPFEENFQATCHDTPGSCKRSVCECDVQLARDFYELRETYNKNNKHAHGNIDTDQVCKSSHRGDANSVPENGGSSGTSVAKQCCGSYPKRFPYNAEKAMCCDGTIDSIGSC